MPRVEKKNTLKIFLLAGRVRTPKVHIKYENVSMRPISGLSNTMRIAVTVNVSILQAICKLISPKASWMEQPKLYPIAFSAKLRNGQPRKDQRMFDGRTKFGDIVGQKWARHILSFWLKTNQFSIIQPWYPLFLLNLSLWDQVPHCSSNIIRTCLQASGPLYHHRKLTDCFPSTFVATFSFLTSRMRQISFVRQKTRWRLWHFKGAESIKYLLRHVVAKWVSTIYTSWLRCYQTKCFACGLLGCLLDWLYLDIALITSPDNCKTPHF